MLAVAFCSVLLINSFPLTCSGSGNSFPSSGLDSASTQAGASWGVLVDFWLALGSWGGSVGPGSAQAGWTALAHLLWGGKLCPACLLPEDSTLSKT